MERGQDLARSLAYRVTTFNYLALAFGHVYGLCGWVCTCIYVCID